LKKLEKMQSRTEIEMAFMEFLKIIQHQVFLRNFRGKVLEKFPVFSDTTAGLGEFPRRQAQGASLDSSAARGQRVHGASPPNHASGLSLG
jgi:hypothetical protein